MSALEEALRLASDGELVANLNAEELVFIPSAAKTFKDAIIREMARRVAEEARERFTDAEIDAYLRAEGVL